MKGIQKQLRTIMIVFIVLLASLALYFIYAINVYGSRWLNSPYNRRLQQQKSSVIAGSILDRNGAVLAYTDSAGDRQYSDNKTQRLAISHVVGDGSGLTSTGAENFMASYLLGFNTNVIERIGQQFSGEARGSDVRLTIDAKLSTTISEAMGSYDGAVVVLNYKTGEILSMVSHPMYDPYQMLTEDGISELQNTALVNRATMGRYVPGSVFKVVTATAALRYLPNATTETWADKGPLVYNAENKKFLPDVFISAEQDKQLRESATKKSNTIAETSAIDSTGLLDNRLLLRNYQSNYYGELTLQRAIEKSANTTMAHISMDVGKSKMTKVAEKYGFNKNFLFSDFTIYSSQYEAGNNQYDLSWSSVGQYKDLATPMHMAMIAGSIANDGIMMEPKLLRSVIRSSQGETFVLKPKQFLQPLSKQEADTLTEYMRGVITNGTGTAANISGVPVCGKTGTAEVSGDKTVGNHAWFIGFIDDVDHPIAIAVILEHAGSGGGKAAPVAKQALQRAINLGY